MTDVELSEFLAARLDEDEATAKDAGNHDGVRPHGQWSHGQFAPALRGQPEMCLHIARHGPARVLAEVAAKRAILAEHRHVPASYEVDGQPGFGCIICARNDDGTTAPLGWCQTTRHLGAPYAGHADYDPAWVPEEATQTAPKSRPAVICVPVLPAPPVTPPDHDQEQRPGGGEHRHGSGHGGA